MEPYITARLETGGINTYTDKVKKMINTLDLFLGVLA
jgi:hypothetical protein